MKKIYYLCLWAGLTFGPLTFTACGDDDNDSTQTENNNKDNNTQKNDSTSNNTPSDSTAVEVPNSDVVTLNDLLGTWVTNSTDNNSVVKFTKDSITILNNGQLEHQSTYTLKDGVVSYPGFNGVTYQSVPGLLYNKSVMVIKQIMKDEMRGTEEMLGMILFKQGKNVTATKNDIQGLWCWYSDFGNDSVPIIRTAIKIDGDNFEIIITPWGERYVGSYTYTNGLLHLEVTAAYTSREEHTGNGSLWGRMDPYTLECDDWRTLDHDYWHIDAISDTPFIANGNEAYGFIANIPSVLQKKE